MKTQISRASFSAANNYSGVFQQMGRMITDADWNELSELVQFQIMDALQDVIGSGTPRERGMVKTIAPNNYQLHWGHLYVDGIHARALPNEKSANPQFIFSKQADFPAAPTLPAGEYRLYADVWERSVTALEDENLLDPGLKGADTCTRTQTMAQIKACATSISINDIQHNAAINPAIGNIPVSLSLRAGKTVKDPCDPCADELALQDEVGNYLFRIEVHHVQWTNDAVPQISGITFKWSSENGAEQYVDGEYPPGFASSQWCYEFFSGVSNDPALHMTSEKHLGHHLSSGFAPVRGELFDGYPSSKPANLPLVRRWDGFVQLQNTAGVWSVVAGADRGRELSNSYSDSDHGFIDLTSPLVINLNETVLSIDLANPLALAGDFWQAPVRQVIHSAGSVLLDKALPNGILHHYFVLGRAQIAADGSLSNFIPERSDCTPFEFPPLTDISAKDVCYDNTDCDGPNVRTVQEALDYLCQQRNLKWHNKHLHGMGVVCGLKVQCAPAELNEDGSLLPREKVTVTTGYALGCEGDDLVLDLPENVDVIAAIKKIEEETGESLLDAEGNATVCIYIDIGEAGGDPVLKIESYDEKVHKDNILDGTIWMDFYQTCIKDLIEDIKDELDDLNINEISEEETINGELVSIRRKKFTTLLNLIVYFFYKPHGAYVFTSRKEHIILRDFYLRLREILQSKTFCGMLKGQEFPDYPFPETAMTTYFGRDHHQQVIVHPNEEFVLTYGGTDTSLNIFEVQSETLIAASHVPSAQGGETTAVTFSNNGELIYAAVDINGMDSILSRGRFEAGKIVWEASAVLCSVRVADLRFMPKHESLLFIVGIGDGLYVVDTSKLFTEEKIIPAPSYSFNAVGHVAYDPAQERLFATAANPNAGETTIYDRVVIIPLSEAIGNMGKTPIVIAGNMLSAATGASVTGRDGIAISPANPNHGTDLYVVVNGSNNNKELRLYAISHGSFSGVAPQVYAQLPNTEITLAYHVKLNRLVVALQDEFRLQLFEQTRLEVERIPVQIMPTALAVSPEQGSVYALNFASNTLSAIPQDELNVNQAFNDALAKYRWEVLLAFVALVGNLLQSLKDCFCHLLLMNCPDCDEKDKVWLATITVKDNEVYKICNIGKRKDVWTFPKFEYWLSLVPILPVLKMGVSKFCCAIFPNIFNRYTEKYEKSTSEYAAVKGETYKQSVQQVKRTDTKVLWRENTQALAAPLALVRDKFLFNQRKTIVDGVDKQQLRNMETQVAVQQMEQKGLQVEVKEYRGEQAGVVLEQYQQTPKIIPQNSKVTVYQQNGRVLFYAAETKQESILKLDDSKLAEFESRKQSLENMQSVEESIARVEARKQSLNETSELQNQLKSLQEEKSKTLEDVAALSAQLNLLRSERAKAQQELVAMQSGMAEISTNLKSLQLEVTKVRPVKELTSVDDKTREILRTEGVLTVNDLANIDSAKLVERGVDAQKVLVMVQEAQNKLKLLR